MTKRISVSEDPIFVTPQLKVKQVSETCLEFSIGRSCYVTCKSETPIIVETHWEPRDGPSAAIKAEYVEEFGPWNAPVTYEEKTGIPWDPKRGYIRACRLQLSGNHSVVLPDGFLVKCKTYMINVGGLSPGNEIELLLKDTEEPAYYTVESVTFPSRGIDKS